MTSTSIRIKGNTAVISSKVKRKNNVGDQVEIKSPTSYIERCISQNKPQIKKLDLTGSAWRGNV